MRATLPAIVEHGYATWMWIDERVAGFAVAARRHLGSRIVDAALDALVATTEAAYLPHGRDKLACLTRAGRSVTVLRILLRGARDRRHISVAQHEHAMRMVDDWGRQIGGWIRSERSMRRGE